ncbi:hypothetical protein BGZ83_001589 [Gryganskiella cystojenkinii]|nr:hypothetical protein BGZ83_001589 [Gryganskiella cystojenkinii]
MGTCYPICRPSAGLEPFYNGRKNHRTMNYQGIVDSESIIMRMSRATDGNTSDVEMFRQSGILPVLQQHAFNTRGIPFAFYGDCTYTLQQHLIVQYD